MIKYLKSLFSQRKTPVHAPKEPVKRKPLNLAAFENLMAQMQVTTLPVRKFEAPKLPDGVRPNVAPGYKVVLAIDSAGNEEMPAMAMDDGGTNLSSLAFVNSSPFFGEVGLTFPGFAFLSTLQQISEYRAPCEVTSSEMTREWVKIVSKGNTAEENTKEDKIKQITERMEELKLQEKFQTVMLYDCQFGGGFLFWDFKDALSDDKRQLPQLIKNIKKDSLKSVIAMEPYWCTPFSYNADRPERPDFYVPQSWYVMGRKIHISRLMVVVSRPVPDLIKPGYNFMGISLAQLMFPYIQRWLRTAKSVNDLISIFSIVNLATNAESILSDDGTNGAGVLQRMKLFTAMRDNKGIFVTDKDSEELSTNNVPLSGLDKLQAQAQEHMAAPSHIPLIKLFGITPTGLGATGEGEIQVWYDWIASQQAHALGDHMNRALEIVQMDLFGEIDDDITYEWVPLFQPTPKEQSELNKSEADRDDKYVAMGAISPDEVRKKLGNDPTSGYNGLSGNAPGPPQDPNMIDPDTGLPVQNANGDTESGGESQENAPSGKDLTEFSMDATFEESKHPRDKGGKFGAGGSYRPNGTEGKGAIHVEHPEGATGIKHAVEYTFAGQPDDGPSTGGKLDSGKIDKAKKDAEKVSALMSGTYEKQPAKAANVKSVRAEQGGVSKAPFVNAFMKDHTNAEEDMARLSKLPDEKLKAALHLLTSHKINDEDAKYMKELITAVLKSGSINEKS